SRFSWLTIYGCYVIILAIICIIVLPLAKVFQKANIFLLFLLFVLYGFSSIILALMLTPFFNRAKVAGIVGQLAQIFMGLLFYLQVFLSDRIAPVAFWFLALLSPCAFSLGLDKKERKYPTFSESKNVGLENGDVSDTINTNTEPFPTEWKGREAVRIRNLHKIFTLRGKEDVHAIDGVRSGFFLGERSTSLFLNRRLRTVTALATTPVASSSSRFNSDEDIDHISKHKRFNERSCFGLSLSMDIYEGEITAILGHNGAGKTTLFNMLTGLTSVTSGTATIYNYNVSDQSDLAEIRKLTGVCPQQDILFLALTPREHLTFYARIKGVPSNLIESKVTEMLRETDLFSKADSKADDLSDIIRHYGKELSFILPSTSSHLFTKLFKTLDSSMEDAGVSDIESYGISMTTLEEVFLALNEEEEGREDENFITDNTEDFDLDQIVVERNDWRAFKALVKLRVLNLSREIAALVFLILFPLGFVVGSMALADSMTVTFPNDEPLMLNTGLYTLTDNNVALIYNEKGKDLSAFDSVLRQSHLTPQEYNGNYRFLYDNQPHFSAFDVHSIDPDEGSLTVRYNTSYAQILPILINIVDNAYMSTYFSPVMIGFVFTMIPAGLVIDFVYDREMNGQNILRLNGVGFNMYFGSFFLVIGFLYFISYIGLLIIIQAFQVPSLTVGAAYACLALLYLIYMPSALIFSCCVSYTFDKQDTARQFYPSMVTTFGFVLYTIVSLVDILGDSDVAFALHVVFTIFVSYYIPFGALYYVNKVYVNHSLANDTDNLTMSDYMTKEIIVMFVVCIVDIFLYYILLRIIYSVKLGGGIKDALWIKKKNSFVESIDETEDSASLVNADKDVKKERAKVLNKTNIKFGNHFPSSHL
ncbi:ATP-binding cassette sub-family A member 8-B, partial [Armadillidium nasatum]